MGAPSRALGDPNELYARGRAHLSGRRVHRFVFGARLSVSEK